MKTARLHTSKALLWATTLALATALAACSDDPITDEDTSQNDIGEGDTGGDTSTGLPDDDASTGDTGADDVSPPEDADTDTGSDTEGDTSDDTGGDTGDSDASDGSEDTGDTHEGPGPVAIPNGGFEDAPIVDGGGTPIGVSGWRTYDQSNASMGVVGPTAIENLHGTPMEGEQALFVQINTAANIFAWGLFGTDAPIVDTMTAGEAYRLTASVQVVDPVGMPNQFNWLAVGFWTENDSGEWVQRWPLAWSELTGYSVSSGTQEISAEFVATSLEEGRPLFVTIAAVSNTGSGFALFDDFQVERSSGGWHVDSTRIINSDFSYPNVVGENTPGFGIYGWSTSANLRVARSVRYDGAIMPAGSEYTQVVQVIAASSDGDNYYLRSSPVKVVSGTQAVAGGSFAPRVGAVGPIQAHLEVVQTDGTVVGSRIIPYNSDVWTHTTVCVNVPDGVEELHWQLRLVGATTRVGEFMIQNAYLGDPGMANECD